MKVYLYSTAGCHLCDLAKAILWPLLVQHQFRLTEIDIADYDELIARYGVKIPVLASPLTERELNWPFGVAEIETFLTELESISDL